MSISLKNITVGKKLLVGFMSIALLVAVTGYIGVREMNRTQRSFEDAAVSSVPAIQALERINAMENEIAVRIEGFPEGSETALQKNVLIGKVETLVRWSERYDRAVIAGDEDSRSAFSQNVRVAQEDVILNAFKLLGLKERGISGAELDHQARELEKAQDDLKSVIDEAIRDELAHIAKKNASVSTAAEETVRNVFLAAALTLAFAASVGLVFARSIGEPIRRLKDSVERFEIGNPGGLTEVPVGSGDEIRQLSRSFDWMTERLKETTVGRDQLERQLGETQNAERKLAAENAFRKAIENSASAGILAVNLDGKLIYANRSFSDMVGWDQDEILGDQPPFRWWPSEEADLIGAFLQDVLVGKAPTSGTELRYEKRNGEQLDVLVLVAPMKGDDGETTGWLASSYDITERKRAAEQIEASLEEKEVMLSEIHHRVKNNLEIVSSLLDLQATDLVDDRDLPLLRRSQDRIRSMALIHEKLYQSEDLANVDFDEYLRSLVADLRNVYGVGVDSVEVKFDVDQIFLGIDSAIPCGLIFNELVSNALKHAFPQGRDGVINISFQQDGNGLYQLVVSDNGVGMPESLNFRSTKSLGLRLVNALTAQLKGTIEVDRTAGTAFKVKFVASKPEVTT